LLEQIERPSSLSSERIVLDNGLTVIVTENPIADIVAARFFLRAGSSWETPNQFGLAHLLSAVLTKGTTERSAQAIASQVESVGAGLGIDATADYFLLSLKTVSADFAQLLPLAAEILRSPSFPADQIELERKLTLQAIRSQQEQPMSLGLTQLRQAIYGDQHPYSQSGLGTETTVAQLEQADLQQFHQTHFRPDNLVISLAGRITTAAAISLIKSTFGDWQTPLLPLPKLDLPTVTCQPQTRVLAQPTQQSLVLVGYLTTSLRSPDHPALRVLNTYLGSGLSSRLFVELREKRGLAYEVSSFYPSRCHPAYFVVYMGTGSENTAIALENLQAEVQRLCDAPLSPAEIQVAQSKLLGQHALSKQTNAQIANLFGWCELLGLGLDYDRQFQANIAAVTADSAHQVAQRYLTAPYISLVGPEAAVAPYSPG
jgi:zinc protease